MAKLYWSYDPEGDGVQFHDTKDDAIRKATAALKWETHMGFSNTQWRNLEYIAWGEVRQRVVILNGEYILADIEEKS